jgi:lysophospholipase L1-like esterase
MPLGDSITAGVGSSDWGGYRDLLWEKIRESKWNIQFVGSEQDGPATLTDRANEGHPGWRIDQISDKIEPWLQATHPQIILLHIGTNDIIQGASPAVAATRLTMLLKQITTFSPAAVVLVAQIIPLGYPSLNKIVVAYDRMIPNIVRSMDIMGKHIMPVDMYNVVPVSDLRDHIHPDNGGYALIANAWYQALSSSILTTH